MGNNIAEERPVTDDIIIEAEAKPTMTAEPEATVQVAQLPPADQLPAAIPRPPIAAGSMVRALVPTNLNEAFRLADAIYASKLAPYGFDTPEKIMVAIMKGLELGLPPMQALDSIAVINGKASLYGDVGLALIRASGLLDGFSETYEGEPFEEAYCAVCSMTRRGDQQVVNRYSVKDAMTGGYWEGKHIPAGDKRARSPWVTNPKRMLRWRARWFTMRDLFSDVLKNMAGVEEMQDVEPHAVAAPQQRPITDVAAKLKGGDKPAPTYIDGKAASSPVEPVKAPEAQPAAETAQASPGVNAAQETAKEAPTLDLFGKSLMEELEAALAEASDAVSVKVAADEFGAAIELMSSPERRADALAKIAARLAEFAP